LHDRDGKLCLVLDLDYTLLNSARWGEIDQQYATKLEDNLEREEGVDFRERQLHSLESIQMWTKLRPNCREFLQALSNKYMMWIHTNGNRSTPLFDYKLTADVASPPPLPSPSPPPPPPTNPDPLLIQSTSPCPFQDSPHLLAFLATQWRRPISMPTTLTHVQP
jgi:hypothetical protein